ncbi:MAG: response regulator transcription factor [Sphingobacteriales bacterium]|nr:MAG: response regulator transcription factor [Sphingobacteriales bacterium]
MNCLIVDDELLAQEIIEHYLSRIEGMVVVGKCNNAIEAFAALNRTPVDLMFLDIKMPEISGLDFIRSLKHPPRIILTTAFTEYALEGYELDVSDYLLKPVSFERFLKAVDKVRQVFHKEPVMAVSQAIETDSFYVKSDRKLVKIIPSAIIYIESQKNYLYIHTTEQKIITYSTLNNMEESLKRYSYLYRVHKSYLINKSHIVQLDNGIILLKNGAAVPLGASYRDDFMAQMPVL